MSNNRPRTRHPHCARCLHSGFSVEPAPADQRPLFTCSSCGNRWTNGLGGEPYLARALKLAGLTEGKWRVEQERVRRLKELGRRTA